MEVRLSKFLDDVINGILIVLSNSRRAFCCNEVRAVIAKSEHDVATSLIRERDYRLS